MKPLEEAGRQMEEGGRVAGKHKDEENVKEKVVKEIEVNEEDFKEEEDVKEEGEVNWWRIMATMDSNAKFKNMMIRWKMVDGLSNPDLKYKVKEFIDLNLNCTNDEIILFVEISCLADKQLKEAAR